MARMISARYMGMVAICLMLLIVSRHPVADTGNFQHAIASAHPLATDAGMQILDEGGNAFDAAITVAAVLAVVEPYSSGIGGGGFWLLHQADSGRQIMVDGREVAPLAAHRDMYLDAHGKVITHLSLDGPLAAGIPGQVAAWVHINKKYGSLPLSYLLAPAIDVARDGFTVDAIYQRLAGFRHKALRQSEEAATLFLKAGEVPGTGQRIVQPELANTLQIIASKGHDGFYRGEIARKLVQGVHAAGGIWSLQDLQHYQVKERKPVTLTFADMTITSAALPSSGGIVMAQIFGMLAEKNWLNLNETQQLHVLVEAMRRAYHDRARYLGDEDFYPVDTKRLVSRDYIRQLAGSIEAVATDSAWLSDVEIKQQEGRDTTHYSILDAGGNRVSATLSINYPFGACFVVPGTGILLNNEMDDFSLKPGTPNAYGLVGADANAIAPGKRMLSSMSPSFIEDEKHLAIIGTPGGSRIITMVLRGILALQQEKSAEQIVSLPRIHHQYLPDRIELEPKALSHSTIEQLKALGHHIETMDHTYGNMQLIIHNKQEKKTTAASDPRGIGKALVKNADVKPAG